MSAYAAVTDWYHTVSSSYERLLQRLIHPLLTETRPQPRWVGTVALIGGLTVATLAIAAIRLVAPVENLSLVYLLVVIWLALDYGRGFAILAAVLAFLAYDFFFIPPVFRVTVNDPAEYVALFALLVAGLVIGQLTAELRRQVHVAMDSQHRTAMLYQLSQEIAAERSQEHLLITLTHRVTRVFGPSGVISCALYVPTLDGVLQPRSVSHADGLPETRYPALDAPTEVALAEMAHTTSRITNRSFMEYTPALHVSFIPLLRHEHAVGVLGILSTGAMAPLITAQTDPHTSSDPQAELFVTICDQIALALERAELQREAIQTQALRESERLKEALLDSVTHDLRTPIAAIQASATSLLQPDIIWNPHEAQEFASVVAISAQRLGRLVDNLLVLSRLEAGMAPPTKVWYPINDIIATAMRQLHLAGQANDHPISVDVADDLLEAPMDPYQIERVMTNLIENALKYSPPASDVRISASIAAAELEVRVSDHGVGIPSEHQGAIFDKFFRLQQPFPWMQVLPPQGTGLGLAICASIVHEHGGRIWVESSPGQGATFAFTLPVPDREALPPFTQEVSVHDVP